MPSGDSNAVNVRVAQRPSLVLVCAGTPNSRTWDASRPTLATRYSVIEFRGDGAPTAWDALDPDRAIDRLVARLADWIARLALPAVHLCGHGAGGVVAQRFAFEFPCSVAALVLEGTLPARPERRFPICPTRHRSRQQPAQRAARWLLALRCFARRITRNISPHLARWPCRRW